MHKICFCFCALLLSSPLLAADPPLVVVACRQYLVEGNSSIHLYLYSLDGKLLQQLTNDSGQDDHSPMFAHDGKSIMFTRVTTGAGMPNQSGKYLLTLADKSISRLPDNALSDNAAKAYAPTTPTIEFNNIAFSGTIPGKADPQEGADALSLNSPDYGAKLIKLKEAGANAPSTYVLESKHFRGPKPLSVFPGYEKPTSDYIEDSFLASNTGPFLVGPAGYGALFVNRHRDSMWAFDLTDSVWHKLQSEWVPGDIYAPQNKSGFYFIRCSMEALGNTGKTVMSAYLEWWDFHFWRYTLCPPLSVFYGAATYYGNGDTSAFVDEMRGS